MPNTFLKYGAEIWQDFKNSIAHKPVKSEIRQWCATVEASLPPAVTSSEISATSFSPNIGSFKTTGFAALADGGGATYARLASAPSPVKPWHIQSQDGAWWGFAEIAPNAKQFGAKGDGINDDTASINAALEYSAGQTLYIPEGVYKCTATLTIPTNTTVHGDGVGAWVFAQHSAKKAMEGTTLLFSGTGAKTWSTPYITNQVTAGGVVPNPDATGVNDANYSLADYSNSDGTAKLFSVAVKGQISFSHIDIRDLRIQLNHNGVSGYNDIVSHALPDDWDIGLLNHAGNNFKTTNVQVVGCWRHAGLAHIITRENAQIVGEDKLANTEFCRYQNSMFQGMRGVSIRSSDLYKVVGFGAGYIDIVNNPNLPFHNAPSGKMRVGSNQYSSAITDYTAVAVVGSNLRLSVNSTPVGIAIGWVLVNGIYSNGISNTEFEDCVITGFDHPSSRRAQDLGFNKASAALEIHGYTVRGIGFSNTKIITHEDVAMHLHQAIDVIWEAGSIVESYPDAVTGLFGVRIIATPSAGSNPLPNSIGQTDNLLIHEICSATDARVDMRPYRNLTPPRFPSGGLFKPSTFKWLGWALAYGRDTYLRAYAGESVGFMNSASVPVYSYDDLNGRFIKSIPVGGYYRVTVNSAEKMRVDSRGVRHSDDIGIPYCYVFGAIANDTVVSVDLGRDAFLSVVEVLAQNRYGRFQCRAATSPYCKLLANSVDASLLPVTPRIGVLTGTTGAAGQLSLSCDDNGVYFLENRTGATLSTAQLLISTGN